MTDLEKNKNKKNLQQVDDPILILDFVLAFIHIFIVYLPVFVVASVVGSLS